MGLFDIFKKKAGPQDGATQQPQQTVSQQQKEEGEALFQQGQQIRDPQTAFPFYERSANLGNAGGCYWVGMMYLVGTGTVKNVDKGLSYLYTAAAQGHTEAKKLYSEYLWAMYKEAITTGQYAPVVPYVEKAAELGDAEAQAKISAFYYGAHGILKQDLAKAKYWAEKAAAQGHPDGIKLLRAYQ